jgi:undecaprenyl-diphosphatase
MAASDKPPPSKPRSPGRTRRAVTAAFNVVHSALDWIGGHELVVMMLLLVAALAIWAFVTIAEQVQAGATSQFDEWVVRALRQPDDPSKPIGPRWLAEVGRDLTALGGVAVLTLLTLAVVGYLWLRRMYGAMWLIVAAATGGFVVTSVLKNWFDRPRPNVVPHLSIVSTSSFPSGHSMLAATVYLTLGALLGRFVRERRLRAYFLIVALVLTLLVGVSRVYMGVHYPTDVFAGWTAGLAWALVCWLVARALQQRGRVEQDAVDSG